MKRLLFQGPMPLAEAHHEATEASPRTHLNLGCGSHVREGWTNGDLWKPPVADLKHFVEIDVGRSPWPFEDDRFEVIRAGCLLPHLPPSAGQEPDPVDVFLNEAFRTLAPGGRLFITAPDPRDVPRALGKVNHYRLIHPEMFNGYLHRASPGVKRAHGGPFSAMSVEWGHLGVKELRRRQEGQRPQGISRILPGFMPLGDSKLGALTHLFRRVRMTSLLRGEKIRIVLTK